MLASLGHVAQKWGGPYSSLGPVPPHPSCRHLSRAHRSHFSDVCGPCLPERIPFSLVPPPARGVCPLSLGGFQESRLQGRGHITRRGIRDWAELGPVEKLSLPLVLVLTPHGEITEEAAAGLARPCWKPAKPQAFPAQKPT